MTMYPTVEGGKTALAFQDPLPKPVCVRQRYRAGVRTHRRPLGSHLKKHTPSTPAPAEHDYSAEGGQMVNRRQSLIGTVHRNVCPVYACRRVYASLSSASMICKSVVCTVLRDERSYEQMTSCIAVSNNWSGSQYNHQNAHTTATSHHHHIIMTATTARGHWRMT